MEGNKQERVLEIFFRGLRGEDLSVQKLADDYQVSTKSISRSINDLMNWPICSLVSRMAQRTKRNSGIGSTPILNNERVASRNNVRQPFVRGGPGWSRTNGVSKAENRRSLSAS